MASPNEGDKALFAPKPQADLFDTALLNSFRLPDNLEMIRAGNFQKPLFEKEHMVPGVTNHMTVDVTNGNGTVDKREYDVYVPVGYDGKKPLPVLFVLHGVSGGDGKGLMEKETGMNGLADSRQKEGNGFMVVYPVAKVRDVDYMGEAGKGKLQDWNSPGAGLTETLPGYDDVDYFKGMISAIERNGSVAVDKDKMYLAGFSSGGEFSRHLKGSIPHTFAGIASVHGTTLGTEAHAQSGDYAADISILSSHDDMLPAAGGRGLMTLPFSRVAGSEPTKQVSRDAEENDCSGLPTVTHEGKFVVTEYKASQCNGYPVKEFFLDGDWRAGKAGGIIGRSTFGPAQHAWDGTGEGGWPILGEKNRSVETSQLVVDELFKYSRNQKTQSFQSKLFFEKKF